MTTTSESKRSTFTLATWNIGGAIRGASHQRNGVPDLDHCVSVLQRFDPDVVCVQEAHEYGAGRDSHVADLASRAGYPYSLSVPISPSHLADDASLALGVLSRYPIESNTYTRFANPGLSAVGPTGEHWVIFNKGYLKARLVIGGVVTTVVNAHCFPLHYFGASPTEDRFASMWASFARDLLDVATSTPAVVAIDLNHPAVEEVLGAALGVDGYSTAFSGVPTTLKGVQQDHILHSGAFELLRARAVPTEVDHSYCEAVLGFQGSSSGSSRAAMSAE